MFTRETEKNTGAECGGQPFGCELPLSPVVLFNCQSDTIWTILARVSMNESLDQVGLGGGGAVLVTLLEVKRPTYCGNTRQGPRTAYEWRK